MKNISFLSLIYGISLLLSISDIYYGYDKYSGLSVRAVPIGNEVSENSQQIILIDENQKPSEIVDDPLKTVELEEEDFDEVLFDESDHCSKKIVVYYTEWRESELPPSEIPYDKLTHINYGTYYIIILFC